MKPTHESIRGYFAAALHTEMENDDRIWLLTGDLGWGMLDKIRDDYPDRYLNVGASEQLLVGAGVGLALSGKIPFCYSITTFLIYRAFEWHRNFLNQEKIPVMLIGSGYEKDYAHDGVTHQPYNLFGMTGLFETQLPNIETYFPTEKEAVPISIGRMITENKPAFMCLRR